MPKHGPLALVLFWGGDLTTCQLGLAEIDPEGITDGALVPLHRG